MHHFIQHHYKRDFLRKLFTLYEQSVPRLFNMSIAVARRVHGIKIKKKNKIKNETANI